MSTGRKLLIGVICAASAAALPATAFAVFPGNNGEILFVSGRGAGGDASADIYVIDGPSDTSLEGPLDNITGQHRHPNWSADGRFIAFALFNGTAFREIYIRNHALGSSVAFTNSSEVTDDHPTFSPDGSKIAWESEVSDPAPPNEPTQTDILVANADGSGPVVNLTDTATNVEQTPVWSPDGEFIYYARKINMASTDLDIMREPADNSGSPTFVPGMFSATAEWQPEISPDGRRLCFTFGDFGAAAADVMVAPINGSSSPVEISQTDNGSGGNPPPTADYNCGWSPDGETIAYTNGAFTSGQLMFAPSDDSGPITPYSANSAFFDGNVDWARIPGVCEGKPATIAGTQFSDDISGTTGNDVIVTFEGKDRVRGKGGNDRICSGKAKDTISGRTGKDRLVSGPGNDKLNGGPDRDRCNGGTGRDAASGCERETKIEQ